MGQIEVIGDGRLDARARALLALAGLPGVESLHDPRLRDLPVIEGQDAAAREPVRRAQPKVGRNEPCACGSGKKSKRCCV